jgi:hypothetical protein
MLIAATHGNTDIGDGDTTRGSDNAEKNNYEKGLETTCGSKETLLLAITSQMGMLSSNKLEGMELLHCHRFKWLTYMVEAYFMMYECYS